MGYHLRYQSTDNIMLDSIVEESEQPKAVALMLHGINADKNEEGLFYHLSKALLNENCNSLRFDFRSHGFSEGKRNYVTIAGETEDFRKSLRKVEEKWNLPIIVIAASFGAVSFLNGYNDYYNTNIIGTVLLNPVLDLQATFLNSKFPHFSETFSLDNYKKIEKDSYIRLDGKLKIGYDFFKEVLTLKPYEKLKKIKGQVLLIHGDKDECVPISLSYKYLPWIENCEFVLIKNATHGFGRSSEESKVIFEICKWMNRIITD